MTLIHMPGPVLSPTEDRNPVELAAVESISGGYGPEMYLGIVFSLPDGGARIWHAWTEGGDTLGDQVDGRALAARLDAADWLHIGDRHSTLTHRGAIRIEAYPLRPVLADVEAGERSPDQRRDRLARFIEYAAAENGHTPPYPGVPRWCGFGPGLLIKKGARS